MIDFLEEYGSEDNTKSDADLIGELVTNLMTESNFHPRHKREGRAWRRADSVRLKENRKNYMSGRNISPISDPVLVGKLLHTPKPCSCSMCCNPRKMGELSIQERRHDYNVRSVEAY